MAIALAAREFVYGRAKKATAALPRIALKALAHSLPALRWPPTPVETGGAGGKNEILDWNKLAVGPWGREAVSSFSIDAKCKAKSCREREISFHDKPNVKINQAVFHEGLKTIITEE